jgi:hypothetical protein
LDRLYTYGLTQALVSAAEREMKYEREYTAPKEQPIIININIIQETPLKKTISKH